MARKRQVDCNPPPCGKRKSRALRTHDPKTVAANQRVLQFPNEHLCVSNNKLFCSACREELSIKSSVVQNHVRSLKHTTSKKKARQE
jgi:hypothetical protein